MGVHAKCTGTAVENDTSPMHKGGVFMYSVTTCLLCCSHWKHPGKMISREEWEP